MEIITAQRQSSPGVPQSQIYRPDFMKRDSYRRWAVLCKIYLQAGGQRTFPQIREAIPNLEYEYAFFTT